MPNRTMCDVLNEMRTCHKTRNYAYLLSLIEEVQHMGNRMEASLWDQGDVKSLQERTKELKQEIAKLKEEKKALDNKPIDIIDDII